MQTTIGSDVTRGICCSDVTTFTVGASGISQNQKYPECGMSPDGNFYTNNLWNDEGQHNHLYVRSWSDGGVAEHIWAPGGKYWNRNNWSVNSNNWLVFTIGGFDNQMHGYHDIWILTRNGSEKIQLTQNGDGQYDEGCDFWEGNPDQVLTPDPPEFSSARITPSSASVLPGGTVNFSAAALDQYGVAMDGAVVETGRKEGQTACRISLLSLRCGMYLLRVADSRSTMVKAIAVGR
jgi:hypothetical protein